MLLVESIRLTIRRVYQVVCIGHFGSRVGENGCESYGPLDGKLKASRERSRGKERLRLCKAPGCAGPRCMSSSSPWTSPARNTRTVSDVRSSLVVPE